MPENNYNSKIEQPREYTTNNGSSYVKTFDVVRSVAGRELINRHAEMAERLGLTKSVKAVPVNGTSNKNE